MTGKENKIKSNDLALVNSGIIYCLSSIEFSMLNSAIP